MASPEYLHFIMASSSLHLDQLTWGNGITLPDEFLPPSRLSEDSGNLTIAPWLAPPEVVIYCIYILSLTFSSSLPLPQAISAATHPRNWALVLAFFPGRAPRLMSRNLRNPSLVPSLKQFHPTTRLTALKNCPMAREMVS